MKSPKSLKNILSSKTPALYPLMEQIVILQHLNKELQPLLPGLLPQHCSIAAVEQDTLVIIASSAAWATRLRLQIPLIIKRFRTELKIKSVAIRVQPLIIRNSTESKRAQLRMSPETSNLLIQLAETTSDPKLGNALRRLSLRPKIQR